MCIVAQAQAQLTKSCEVEIGRSDDQVGDGDEVEWQQITCWAMEK